MSTKMTPQLRFPEFTDKWQVKKLGDIAVKVSDRNNATSASTVLTNSAVHGVIPQTDFFDKEIAVQGNLSNYYKTELDDFVYNPRISTSAPVGPFKRNNYGSGVLSPLYNLYRFRGGQVLTFFEQYLKSIHWHKYMKDVANYGARSDRMAISSADLLALPLPYPSKPEQEKIADFLTAVDERIAVGEKKLELLETYKRGVMQKIFSQQVRFKDENGNPYPDWEEKKLGELIDIGSSKRVLQEDWQSSGVPFYRTREIINLAQNQPFRTPIFISENLYNELSLKYGAPKKGDLLVSGVGSIGSIYLIDNDDRFYFKDGNVLWLKQSQKLNSKYLYYVFQTRFVQKQIQDNASITTVATFTIEGAKNTRIMYPSVKEQQKIADFLTTLDYKITAEKSKLTAARQFKKALLQRMFV